MNPKDKKQHRVKKNNNKYSSYLYSVSAISNTSVSLSSSTHCVFSFSAEDKEEQPESKMNAVNFFPLSQ